MEIPTDAIAAIATAVGTAGGGLGVIWGAFSRRIGGIEVAATTRVQLLEASFINRLERHEAATEKKVAAVLAEAKEHLARVEGNTDQSFRDLWSAVDAERVAASKFRTEITGVVSTLPTRQDMADQFAHLDNKLTTILSHQQHAGE